jgi:hypothetical protein
MVRRGAKGMDFAELLVTRRIRPLSNSVSATLLFSE